MGNVITVIGAGLAGVEAAHTLSRYGYKVNLYEMKPKKFSPAHKNENFAELVCSNSLKADRLSTPAGLLKAEMRVLGSLTLEVAAVTSVPAGGALAVDRDAFSKEITRRIKADENITVITDEVTQLPKENAIVATGPLTSEALSAEMEKRFGASLSFYDAIAPIVSYESVDLGQAFMATRYGKGQADYLNCPLNEEEYNCFYDALITAETAPLSEFDKDKGSIKFYEGCIPVEVLAKRSRDALRYGCMKPVGIDDPRTGRYPYALVQLRKENTSGEMYNLVGFQTNLRFPEQKRVFSLVPALRNAEFLRFGQMHRNTFIDGHTLLDQTLMLKGTNGVYFAGQITGVEGYMESAASGIIAALGLIQRLNPDNCRLNSSLTLPLSRETMIGALISFITDSSASDRQPMGANMGLLPPLEGMPKIKSKQERYEALSKRSLDTFNL